MDNELLDKCQAVIGYKFQGPTLLIEALTHASSCSITNPSNERMEFFGDSIVGMVVCEYLYRMYPQYSEGRLTKMKSAIVSRTSLGRVARIMQLDDFLIVGPGMQKRKNLPNSIYANVFEAIVAAVYLDGGMDVARELVLRLLAEEFAASEVEKRFRNYKSILQQFAQKTMAMTPTYRVTREEGPDHLKFFEVIALIGDMEYRSGWGRSKKDAEQRAAEETTKCLNVPVDEYAEGGPVESAEPVEPSEAEAGQ